MKATHLLMASAAIATALSVGSSARAQSCDPPHILFVIDSSSSMLDDITEGGTTTTKWQAAQDAVHAVLAAYGDAAQYGLMTFPGPSGGCTTGTVLVDIGPGTATQIESTLSSLDMLASRATPAGQTLVAASNYAGITDPTYPNFVIFMSDGWQYCSIPTSSAPVCASSADCSLMGVASCPTCNSCNDGSTDPACSGQNSDGCYCVRSWPVMGVEALAAANVTTYVVGFGSQVDAKTLNQAADAAGTALAGCDPTSNDPSCYFQATAPSELNDTLANIVQQVVVADCAGPCDIGGTQTCTSSGWSACDAPTTVTCQSACGTTGSQQCVGGTLTDCDAVCEDAGTGGGAGAGGGTGGGAGEGGAGGAAGAAGAAATGGGGGAPDSGSAATGGGGTDAGATPGPSGSPAASEDDGGCACRTSPKSAPFSGLLALAAAAALTLLRRRR